MIFYFRFYGHIFRLELSKKKNFIINHGTQCSYVQSKACIAQSSPETKQARKIQIAQG